MSRLTQGTMLAAALIVAACSSDKSKAADTVVPADTAAPTPIDLVGSGVVARRLGHRCLPLTEPRLTG